MINHKPKEEKSELRSKYLYQRKEFDPEKKIKMDAAICNTLSSLVSYKYAENVLMYYPKSTEIDIRPFMEKALADGKKVALPRCAEDGSPIMDFHFISSFDDLELGIFKIMAPKRECVKFDPSRDKGPTLILVPALTFDRQGYRLGYGKGYYDRYIDKKRMTAIGIVYADNIEERLPRSRFDTAVHFMVTDKGVVIID